MEPTIAPDHRIPVTVLTGFLGSGKTTLLNRILTEQHGRRIAVIENEFGEVGVDNELVVNADEEIFEMNNGCICCTVRGDLIRILGNLAKRRDRFEAVLIETTGSAWPRRSSTIPTSSFSTNPPPASIRSAAVKSRISSSPSRGAVSEPLAEFYRELENVLAVVTGWVGGFAPVESLSAGRSVGWSEVARALFQIIVTTGGTVALAGMVLLQRRELALAQTSAIGSPGCSLISPWSGRIRHGT
jgi:hypothetical protein